MAAYFYFPNYRNAPFNYFDYYSIWNCSIQAYVQLQLQQAHAQARQRTAGMEEASVHMHEQRIRGHADAESHGRGVIEERNLRIPVEQLEEERHSQREQQQKEERQRAVRDEEVWRRLQAQQQEMWKEKQRQDSLWYQQNLSAYQPLATGHWDGFSGRVDASGAFYNGGYAGLHQPRHVYYSAQAAQYQQHLMSSSPSWDGSLPLQNNGAPHFPSGFHQLGHALPQHPQHRQLFSSPESSSPPVQDNAVAYSQQFFPQEFIPGQGYYQFGHQTAQSYGGFAYNHVAAPARHPGFAKEVPFGLLGQSLNQNHAAAHVQYPSYQQGDFLKALGQPNNQSHPDQLAISAIAGQAGNQQHPNSPLYRTLPLVNGGNHPIRKSAQALQYHPDQSDPEFNHASITPEPAPRSVSPFSVVKNEIKTEPNPFVRPGMPTRGPFRLQRHVSARDKNARVVEWLKTRPAEDVPIRTRKRSASSPSPCERAECAKRIKEEGSSAAGV